MRKIGEGQREHKEIEEELYDDGGITIKKSMVYISYWWREGELLLLFTMSFSIVSIASDTFLNKLTWPTTFNKPDFLNRAMGFSLSRTKKTLTFLAW